MKKKTQHKTINGIEYKRCSKCGEWLPLSDFSKNKRSWDGLNPQCKGCAKQYNAEHAEERAVYYKQYRTEHRDELLEQQKQYYQDNKEEIKQYQKQYRAEHPDLNKKQREKNPMKRAAFDRIHSHKQNDKKNCRGEGNLTVDWYIENILLKSCVHCGETDWRKLGCNRLDNSKPHTIDNVECCCRSCNSKLANKELKSKQIDKIDPITGEVLASFISAREAARILNISQGGISACARGEKPIANGYIWKYLQA